MDTPQNLDYQPEPIHFLMFDGFSMLGLFSAMEPLRVANQLRKDLYSWHFLSLDGQAVKASNGMDFNVDHAVEDCCGLPTLFICAGFHPERACTPELLSWLRARAAESTILGGIDTGSVILARAGLLKGYRATVHWEHLAAFQEDFLDVKVTGSLFEIDRNRFTSSGGTSSLDLMLQLISLKHGYNLAVQISEQLIHERIREPHDDQRMPVSLRLQIHHPKLIKIIELMENHLDIPLAIDSLAEQLGLSSRQISRIFRNNLNMSPGRFYLKLRLDKARQLLSQTSMSILDVAMACGFSSNAAFTKAFKGFFGLTPRQERHQGHQD
jgi:AraC family carnitine catabolism transcriptional activator